MLETLRAQAAATSALELAAVALGAAYIVLAIGRRRGCWIAGGLSTALYVLVFLQAGLYLQSALQVVYVGLAVYGWRQWTAASGAAPPPPRSWPVRRHAQALLAVAVATLATAPLLARFSDAAAPWSDALGTWSSVAATWMMAQRVAAHWLWWIVIDLGLAVLFASQALVFTAALYAGFAVMAVAGFAAWRRALAAPGPAGGTA
jgi:nicotinamide mononucleotide transporter